MTVFDTLYIVAEVKNINGVLTHYSSATYNRDEVEAPHSTAGDGFTVGGDLAIGTTVNYPTAFVAADSGTAKPSSILVSWTAPTAPAVTGIQLDSYEICWIPFADATIASANFDGYWACTSYAACEICLGLHGVDCASDSSSSLKCYSHLLPRPRSTFPAQGRRH